ncbi:hypothetical protein ACFOQM_06140 [Paenibacillus sp. GCM10012307]|uniref:Uncharacterized protein n=1 Tax=Paenibacillus roseus TaxID=2798579 RepID=A0A934MPH2_9BACL|nr:hypothetical protein [Paenibacillus roseus]MBJ6360878.1 hypothetical protein [Paenibacillus roseus]
MKNDAYNWLQTINRIVDSPAQQMIEKMKMIESRLTLSDRVRDILLPSDSALRAAQDATRYMESSAANQIKSIVEQVSVINDPFSHSYDKFYTKIRNLQEAILDTLPLDIQDEESQKTTPDGTGIGAQRLNIQQILNFVINVLIPLALTIYTGNQSTEQLERHHIEQMEQNERHHKEALQQNSENALRLEAAIQEMLNAIASFAPEQLDAPEANQSTPADGE